MNRKLALVAASSWRSARSRPAWHRREQRRREAAQRARRSSGRPLPRSRTPAAARSTETETGDDGAAYSVEVELADGSQVEVNLDENFDVIGQESDDDGAKDEASRRRR